MTWQFYVAVAIGVVISFIFGHISGIDITKKTYRNRSLGTIRVDSSDPEDGPYLFLELNAPPSMIAEKDYVMFKVNTESYISQK